MEADRLCEPGTSLESARAYLGEVAANASPTSLMIMKQQVYRHLMVPLGPAMAETEQLMNESLSREDFREGVRSFMERRPPDFARITLKGG